MKKIIGIIIAALIILLIGFWLTREKPAPVYSDIPTEQEQQAIEKEQKAPEAIAESDMETLSPEDAEKDQ